ncbi:hypothetical protein NFI96_015478, partial [Prochilodus magdalenae]
LPPKKSSPCEQNLASICQEASEEDRQQGTMKPKSFLDVQLPQIGLVGLDEGWSGSSGRYQRQIDTGAPAQTTESEDFAIGRQAKEAHFAFLPKNYVPLEENENILRAKEEKKAKRKENVSDCRFVLQNVGKALRYSWKCLMLGLQNFTVGYSTPITAAATLVPDFRAKRAKS